MINLKPQELKLVDDILKTHVPNCTVWVFGSRITPKIKPYSDLDLVIIDAQPLSIRKYGQLREAFQASILPMRVDVLDWHRLSPEFQAIVLGGYEVLQGNFQQSDF